MHQLLALLVTALFATSSFAQDQNHVLVRGNGVVQSVPDMAVLSLSVMHQAPSAAEATKAVAKDARNVLDRLATFGVAEIDIQTTGLSLNPVYDRRANDGRPPAVIGFSAANRMTVRARDLGRLGEMLDGLINAGANSLQGLSFDISDPAPLQKQARRAAVADALEKAEVYATAAGRELGEVLEISETSAASPSPMMRAESFMSDAMPIAAGSQSVSVQIWIKVSLR